MRSNLVAVMAGLVCLIVLAASAVASEIIDQSQTSLNMVRSIPYFSPLGQSFIPALTGVDFVELKMSDTDTAVEDGQAFVRLRDTLISGAIIGTSEVVPLQNGFNVGDPNSTSAGGTAVVVRFDFSTTVPVTPGHTYVLEVEAPTGFFGVGYQTVTNPYPNGTMFSDGATQTTSDLWFREGLVPEPNAAMLLLLTGPFARRRNS